MQLNSNHEYLQTKKLASRHRSTTTALSYDSRAITILLVILTLLEINAHSIFEIENLALARPSTAPSILGLIMAIVKNAH